MKSEHSSGKQASRLQALVGQTMIAVLKGALGVLLGCLIVYGIALRVSTPHSSSAPQATTYIWNGEAKPDDASWRLALRDMTEAESLRIETRLRDHFTLLLALAGISTALILGLFSLLQSRREEKALEELRELKREAVTLCREAEEKLGALRREAEEKLNEIRACVDQSYNLSSELETFARSKLQGALSSSGAELGSSVAVPDTPQAEIFTEQGAQEEDATKPADSAQLLAAAEGGDADAQWGIGSMYTKGSGVEKNEEEAVRWYRKAAEQGDARGQCCLGISYDYGQGVKKNEAEAVHWYLAAAEQGVAVAQLNLGSMYANGEGVEKNEEEAARLFRKAAEQGLAVAQFNLGAMYTNGWGVGKNEAEASRWFLAAARQGFLQAVLQMAWRYHSGIGVTEDFEDAYVFLLLYKALANSEDNGEVQSLQKSLRELLSKAQIAGAQRKASELFNDIRDKA